jgi:hypothetical protein
VKYIDWVERVGRAAAEEYVSPGVERSAGVGVGRVLERLGLKGDPSVPGFLEESGYRALLPAIGDLVSLGLVEEPRGHPLLRLRLTREGRRLATTSLRMVWPQIHDEIHLDDEQLALLTTLVRLSEEQHDDFAFMRKVGWEDAFQALGWAPDRGLASEVTAELEGLRCVGRVAAIGFIKLTPTYLGVVRATEAVQTEWQRLVASLLPEWETTNVEFKRELNLKSAKEKAKFVRNVLALATTKSSGRRFLVIGFDPKTRQFTKSVDPAITQDPLEQILNVYTEPIPEVRYHQVTWEGGQVGAVEVLRDPAKVPYRVAQALGNVIAAGQVYVRHGTQVEAPTDAELAALEAEGQAARGRR